MLQGRIMKKIKKHMISVVIWAWTSFDLMAQPIAMLGDLKSNLGKGLGIMMAFGFFWGIIKIWSGASAVSKGDPEGKMGIVGGIIIAAAVGIMTLLFNIFGMEGATLKPSF